MADVQSAADGINKAAVDEKESKIIDGPIICPGHSRPVPDLAFSPVVDGRYYLASSCLDGKPMLRDGETGNWIGTFNGHKGAVWSCRLDYTALHAVTAAADSTCKLWDALTGENTHTWEQKHIVRSAVFSVDGKKVYAGGYEKKLYLYDVASPASDPHVILGLDVPITHILTVPDVNLVATVGREIGIKIWDLRAQAVARTLPTENKVNYATISSNGGVISTCSGKTVQFYDALNFELTKTVHLSREIECASYHHEANKFVTGSPSEPWVRIYNYETLEEIGCNKGHHGPARCLDITPNGLNFASGSEDGTIRIWQWPTESEISTYKTSV